MFLKTAELKKLMKDALKRSGLVVGYVNGNYLVCTDSWGAYINDLYASNKFKAAIMELVGDLPEKGECYRYTIKNKIPEQETVMDYPNPYRLWMEAKDPAVITPMGLMAWPHTYTVVQRKSDLAFLTVKNALVGNIISESELEKDESMPGRPNLLGATLYFKNESGLWWAATESAGHKVEEALFPQMEGINFFEDSWLVKTEWVGEETGEAGEADEGPLPY